MAPKREGPFEIAEVLGPLTYRLKLPESWRIHNVFHAALLRPYKENEIYGENYPRPPPDIEEGEEVWEVESILKHRRRGRGYEYFVKWAGYPITEGSWEPNKVFLALSTSLTTTNNNINSDYFTLPYDVFHPQKSQIPPCFDKKEKI